MSNPYIVYMAPVRPPGWKPVRPAWENTEAPKPPESTPVKRKHNKSVVNGLRRRETEGQRSHLGYARYISRRLAELQKREKELEAKWGRIHTDCMDYHENIQFWRVGDKVIVKSESETDNLRKWAHVGTVQEILTLKSKVSNGYKPWLRIQGTFHISSVQTHVQYEHEEDTRTELWNQAVNDTPETRKLVYEIMCVASEIRHLSQKLRR